MRKQFVLLAVLALLPVFSFGDLITLNLRNDTGADLKVNASLHLSNPSNSLTSSAEVELPNLGSQTRNIAATPDPQLFSFCSNLNELKSQYPKYPENLITDGFFFGLTVEIKDATGKILSTQTFQSMDETTKIPEGTVSEFTKSLGAYQVTLTMARYPKTNQRFRAFNENMFMIEVRIHQ